MARSALDISGRDLAALAGVGYATLARFEAGAAVAVETRSRLETALVDAGAQFLHRSGRVGVTISE